MVECPSDVVILHPGIEKKNEAIDYRFAAFGLCPCEVVPVGIVTDPNGEEFKGHLLHLTKTGRWIMTFQVNKGVLGDYELTIVDARNRSGPSWKKPFKLIGPWAVNIFFPQSNTHFSGNYLGSYGSVSTPDSNIAGPTLGALPADSTSFNPQMGLWTAVWDNVSKGTYTLTVPGNGGSSAQATGLVFE
jgi:hypothetical protein